MSGPTDSNDPSKVLSYLANRLADETDDDALAKVFDLDEYRRIRARNKLADVTEITVASHEFDDDLDPVS